MSTIGDKPRLRLATEASAGSDGAPIVVAPPPGRDTPAMRQYYAAKRDFPGHVVFFRIGDFYELFDDDAVTASRALGLTLTRRSEGVPMAGVPHHSAEGYFRRMLAQGFRLAICDQTEDASLAKGSVVQRAVTRVLTPGALVDESLLEEDRTSALAAVQFLADDHAAAALVDVSTGDFRVFDGKPDLVAAELSRLAPAEVLYAETADGVMPARTGALLDELRRASGGGRCAPRGRPAWRFRARESLEALLGHFGVASLAGFGLRDDDACVGPAGAALQFLLENSAPGANLPSGEGRASDAAGGREVAPRRGLSHLRPPKRETPGDFLTLDAASMRALEIEQTIRAVASGGGAAADRAAGDGSLLGLFLLGPSAPRTAMGKRLVREWLRRPLARLEAIEERLGRVAALVNDARARGALRDALGEVQDVARIAARAALGRATARDIVALGRSLAAIEALGAAVAGVAELSALAGQLAAARAALAPLSSRILERCVDSPPGHLRDGGLFRDGVDAELDECRGLERDASSWLAAYQARLAETHGLPGIKVGYNRVFGYYIELPQAQSRRAPAELVRKQTLKNAERYTTPELKEFEEKVTTARSRAVAREQALFEALCAEASRAAEQTLAFADAAAALDALACFAEKASRRGWARPRVVGEAVMDIAQGRHPVLDELLENDFVPNDLRLGVGELFAVGEPAPGGAAACLPCMALITGPNMGGKSTYIRQAALLTVLAHAGSFVPAERAVIGLADRVFTRVGADDALHAGQSTFMVEMTETANILHHATAKSLVILDEIGRGTSTLDGLALAWAIAERLAGREAGTEARRHGVTEGGEARCPRTLFATHYHEITRLEEELPGRVVNLHVAVREWAPEGATATDAAHPEVVFLHRILPGRADRSYGVQVARLAGLPSAVVLRARELLETLTVSHGAEGASGAGGAGDAPEDGSKNAPSRSRLVGGAAGARRGRKADAGEGAAQAELFAPEPAAPPATHPVVEELKGMNLDAMTPLQAFDALRRMRESLGP